MRMLLFVKSLKLSSKAAKQCKTTQKTAKRVWRGRKICKLRTNLVFHTFLKVFRDGLKYILIYKTSHFFLKVFSKIYRGKCEMRKNDIMK